jgi:hypothetical protein
MRALYIVSSTVAKVSFVDFDKRSLTIVIGGHGDGDTTTRQMTDSLEQL